MWIGAVSRARAMHLLHSPIISFHKQMHHIILLILAIAHTHTPKHTIQQTCTCSGTNIFIWCHVNGVLTWQEVVFMLILKYQRIFIRILCSTATKKKNKKQERNWPARVLPSPLPCPLSLSCTHSIALFCSRRVTFDSIKT